MQTTKMHTCVLQVRTVSFQSDNATYWPGMQNTAFLVIFMDLSVQKYFLYMNRKNFSIFSASLFSKYP